MNISRAMQTPGWMGESELIYLAHLAMKATRIVEIGTWQGRSARVLSDNTQATLYCVDTWADNAYGDAPAEITGKPEWLWEIFQKRFADDIGKSIIPWRMNSVEGAAQARVIGLQFDMIFIDAGHNYEDVIADINAWKPLLMPGGVLCGHDLYPDGPHHPGVLQAVNELIGNYQVFGTIWSTEGL